MNIGLFTDSYYPEVTGVATSMKVIQTELRKRGHKVYIFTTTNPGIGIESHSVFRLPSMPLFFFKARRLGIFYAPRASRCVKQLKLDIIHTQSEFSLGIFGKIMAKQMGIPLVHTYHTLWKDYVHYITKGKFKKYSSDAVRVLTRNYCNGCDEIVAPTWKVFDILREYGVYKPIRVIPSGIDIDRFRKEKYTDIEIFQLKEKFGIQKDDPVVLFVGRVGKEKSIDVIIKQMPKVIKHIANAKLLIIGEGPIRGVLSELTKELNIEKSVIFAGECPWDQIGKYYRLGDVFVSASTTETQGITIIEAMASGVPVVVKDDRNIERLIQNNKNGRIFKSKNRLAEILIEVLSNKSLSKNIAMNALKTVEEYSAENFGKRIEAVYLDILKHSTIKTKKKGYTGLKYKNLNNSKT